MSTTTLRSTLAGLALASLMGADASAQKLYGFDGTNGVVHEFTTTAGPPCGQATPTLTSWPYTVPSFCGLTPGFTPPPGPQSFGDVATDSLTDTVWITDGFIVEHYAEFSPVSGTAAGTPLEAWVDPLVAAGFGPITGLGMDDAGAAFGLPVLFMCSGPFIWAVAVPGPAPCAPGPVVMGPFPTPFPMGPGISLQDVTFDPASLSLFLCDDAGMIHNVALGGGPGPFGFFPAAGIGVCGMTPRLQGIAIDLATTPSPFAPLPNLYVTDGFFVAYLDATGGPAAPTFYSPVTCTPTPKPLNGLAFVNHSIEFGPAPGLATLSSYGQPSSPGPTYGVTVTSPAPAFLWLATGTNLGGPFTGTFCPPLSAVGNPLYVDAFTAPGGITPIGPIGVGTTILPSPIAGGLPPGVEIYIQAFLDLTPGGPGGPWLSTNAIDMVITAP